jgi:hypothetical protein
VLAPTASVERTLLVGGAALPFRSVLPRQAGYFLKLNLDACLGCQLIP